MLTFLRFETPDQRIYNGVRHDKQFFGGRTHAFGFSRGGSFCTPNTNISMHNWRNAYFSNGVGHTRFDRYPYGNNAFTVPGRKWGTVVSKRLRNNQMGFQQNDDYACFFVF